MNRLFFIFLTSTVLAIAPNVNKFNIGQLTPLIEGMQSWSGYKGGVRTMENMLPSTRGPAIRRPGTEYIGAIAGAIPQSIDIREKLKYVAHARGGSTIVSVTDDTPSLAWTVTDTNNVALHCDIDQTGYVVINQYYGGGDSVDDYSPLLLYEADGTATGIDFLFGTAQSDVKKNVSANRDVRFSPDAEHIYMISWSASKLRLHKYNRDGTRDWRVAFDKTYSEYCGSFAIDEDEGIYMGAGGNTLGRYILFHIALSRTK